MQVKFYAKLQTTKKDCPLFARINYNYDKAAKKYLTVKYVTDIRIDASKWDVKNQCAKKGMIGKPEFDLRITNAKQKIQKSSNGYINPTGKVPEPEALKKIAV